MNADWDGLNLGPAAEPNFFNETALRPLYEVNDALLQLMVELASRSETDSALGLVASLRGELLQLDAATRNCLASCPIALLDLGFTDPSRWGSIASSHEPLLPSPLAADSFPRLPAIHLAHAALTLAWTLVRASREVACIVFGMTPSCAAIVAELGVQSIQRVAERCPYWVRPRWEKRPKLWSELLQMSHEPARSRHPSSVSLYLLQHQLADVAPMTLGNRATRANAQARYDRR
jgi:hypothetical protein